MKYKTEMYVDLAQSRISEICCMWFCNEVQWTLKKSTTGAVKQWFSRRCFAFECWCKTPALRCAQKVSTAREQITWSYLTPGFVCLLLGVTCSPEMLKLFAYLCISIAASDPRLFSFCVFSWSSCTRWASAPERTVSGSSPSTSGTCRWPAATWSDGRGKKGPAPVTGKDLKLAQKDECDVFLAAF